MRKSRESGQERFTTGELAQLVQASRNTIVRHIEEGTIRARRTVGGWYIIPREEVIAFLWDLSFSKTTPLRMWRAATLAYEQMTRPPKPSQGRKAAPARGRSRKRG